MQSTRGAEGEDELATRAAHSLFLTSASVRAAVLASVDYVGMDAPLPVLQRMTSLGSLRVGPGPLDPSHLPQLTCLQADGLSSPQALSAVMQLTRLQALKLGIGTDDYSGGHAARAALAPHQPP
jgi:hypothetical protein